MPNFIKFCDAVSAQITCMSTDNQLFRTNVGKDDLWKLYLNSFDPADNPKYIERTVHDCQCCKQFIRTIGGVVSINQRDLTINTIWDIEPTHTFYDPIAEKLASYVRASTIFGLFLHDSTNVGCLENFKQEESGSVTKFSHFHTTLSDAHVYRKGDLTSKIAAHRESHDLFKRSLNLITIDALDTIIELATDNSVYRLFEYAIPTVVFRKVKLFYDSIAKNLRDTYLWSILSATNISLIGYKNTVIGTLAADLSEGMNLDKAIYRFEHKMDPSRFNHPRSIVTKTMLNRAKNDLTDAGLLPALSRRYATIDDISPINVLFRAHLANRALDSADLFDLAEASVPDAVPKNREKIQTIPIRHFIKDILPTLTGIDAFFENSHEGNLVSMTTATDPTAPNLFKWPNQFAWSYNGGITDSLKVRVKSAGGNVTGFIRCSLGWNNSDDLDLHMKENTQHGQEHIYFGHMRSSITGAHLDVDANASRVVPNPVENIAYKTKSNLLPGTYELVVHQYRRRSNADGGFFAEIEIDGKLFKYAYQKHLAKGESIPVATITNKAGDITITHHLKTTDASQTLWSINTQKFHPITAIMMSPNHWNSHAIGNKHYLFMLSGCVNPDGCRSFFNEYLHSDLHTHKKALGLLGSKAITPPSPEQLSGLGFSSTQSASLLLRCTGTYTRLIKVIF